MLVADRVGERVVLDFSVEASGRGAAPGRRAELVAIDVSFGDADQVFNIGPASVGCYGMPAGIWEASRAHGSLPLSDLTGPAARLAREGVPLNPEQAYVVEILAGIVTAEPECAAVYAPEGRVLGVGDPVRQPELAATLERLGAEGPRPFYRGDIARRILLCSRRHHGALAAGDLEKYDGEWVTPLETTYHGWTVYELPPNGQGIAALMMLNLLEQSPLSSYGHNSIEALHTLIEAKKLAYADLARCVCDPLFHDVEVDALLSKDFAAARARQIDPGRANPEVHPGRLPGKGSDTTYLSVADREGNMVSLIQSNFANFGSGLVPEGAGFALQSRGALFSLDPGVRNALAPGKRPLHTIIPGFMANGDVRIAFGIMGGWNQSQAHAQFVSNVVDHGMNIQAALEAPRVTKLTFEGNDVIAESRIPEAVIRGLEAKGHEVEVCGAFSSLVGGGQSVMRDYAAGVNYGASDPRKDGAAIPEPFLT